jgi:hypothetical protein
VVHDDIFRQDAIDEEWLSEAGRQGWIALTKDVARVQSALQRIAVARNNARLFVWNSRAVIDQRTLASILVSAAGEMIDFAGKNAAPFVAYVYSTGELRLVRNRKELLSELRRFRT